jgi:hypothetical protein
MLMTMVHVVRCHVANRFVEPLVVVVRREAAEADASLASVASDRPSQADMDLEDDKELPF